ncbi:hypothetical protein SAMN05216259_10527 [Actinacidiphila guanduensis]|uniref:Uncharacterized protein n=1 Tax=Actinacidiphila guanduensis TaxID=310781 RepID=A0A1H0D199_9ACTN|nr:hypothetical protein SAMN05216259_10527 [Actinacidiphila guanduensis]
MRALLERELRSPRVPSLETACARLADRPLDDTLADLDDVLSGPVTVEAGWRLQVLVSALYHHAGASLPLTEELRARIHTAQATTAKE